MRLEITRRSELATKGLVALARSDSRIKSKDLATEIGTTAGFLSQAMSPLVARGWVRSDPGPNGGYSAVADPTELAVLDVIEAIEGPTDTHRCVLEDRDCSDGGQCALHQPWTAARSALLASLAATPVSGPQTRTAIDTETDTETDNRSGEQP